MVDIRVQAAQPLLLLPSQLPKTRVAGRVASAGRAGRATVGIGARTAGSAVRCGGRASQPFDVMPSQLPKPALQG